MKRILVAIIAIFSGLNMLSEPSKKMAEDTVKTMKKACKSH